MSEARIETGLTRGACAALSDLLGEMLGIDAPDLPLIAPVLLLGHVENTSLAPPEGKAALHESQRIEALTSWATDVPLNLRHSVEGGRMDLTISGPDGPAARLETRIRFATPAQVEALKGAVFADRMAGEGARWAATSPITQARVDRYLALSGDTNPIHHNADAAQVAGFAAPIVPGMVLAGLAEVAHGQAKSLVARFMAPVPVGATLNMVVVPRGVGARVFTLTEDRTIAAITDLEIWA